MPADPLHAMSKTLAKRSSQVLPNGFDENDEFLEETTIVSSPSGGMTPKRFQQHNTHPWLCYFSNSVVENDFQNYYRRNTQQQVHYYMVIFLFLSLAVAISAVTQSVDDISIHFLTTFFSSQMQQQEDLNQGRDGIVPLRVFLPLVICFFLAASCVVLYVSKRMITLSKKTTRKILDGNFVQLAIVLFFHLVSIPVIFTLVYSTDRQLHQLHRLTTTSSNTTTIKEHDSPTQLVVVLGLTFMDTLYFYFLLALSLTSCLLRAQFRFFLGLVLETHLLVLVLSIVFFPEFPERWSLFGVFIVVTSLLTMGVRDQELIKRRDFLSSCHLVSENRRLSYQNIEMKEELSGKLNYQLHYEMGDILRILCQIKQKMGLHERRDIDKIISTLVTNQDLFEVSLDTSMVEHEEEVQAWLQMMAFKDIPSRPSSPADKASISSIGQQQQQQQMNNHPTNMAKLTTTTLPTMATTSTTTTTTVMTMMANVVSFDKMKKRASNSSFHHILLSTLQSRRTLRHSETEERCATGILTKFFNEEIPTEETEELARWLFDAIRDHFFVDIFFLDKKTTCPLQMILIACTELNDFGTRLHLDMKKMNAFAGAVENHYLKKNPYHNGLHAAAVVLDMNFYLRRIKLNVDDTTFFVGLIAAAAHDISHPGVSNGFLIATRSKIAITYSDDSVLERMHAAELYRILSHEKFDIFSHFEKKTEIRKLIIQMILATDLSKHFSHISKLKSKKFAVLEEKRGHEAVMIMETLLMLADLGHTTKPFPYHQVWANRIAEEFYRQGDAEEKNQMPISPLCDRKQANLPKSQVTFLTILAQPLFETALDAFEIDEFQEVKKELLNNIKQWQNLIGSTDTMGDGRLHKANSTINASVIAAASTMSINNSTTTNVI